MSEILERNLRNNKWQAFKLTVSNKKAAIIGFAYVKALCSNVAVIFDKQRYSD